jgi:hypothetical protein
MEMTNISTPASQNDTMGPVLAGLNKTGSTVTRNPAQKENQGLMQNPMAQMLSISNSIDYITDQLQSILTSFPPYFPLGSAQRVDLIKGIKGLQEKIENAPVPATTKKELIGPRLPNQATDDDITTALKGLSHFKDFVLQNTSVNGTKEAGTVLNLKI